MLKYTYSHKLPALIITLFLYLLIGCNIAPMRVKTTKSIIVEASVSKYFYYRLKEVFIIRDVLSVGFSPFHYLPSDPKAEYISGRVIDGKVTWIINSDVPIKVIPPFGTPVIMNPGDSIHIAYIEDQPVYSGKNQQCLALLDTLMVLDGQILKPRKKNSYNAAALGDFLEWNMYLDNQLLLQLPIIDSYKDKISAVEFNYYKANFIGRIEHDRVSAFTALYDSVQRNYPGLSYSDLIQIWDSTQQKPSRQWFQSLQTYNGSMYNFYSYLSMETFRKFGFDSKNDTLKSHEYFTHLLYTNAKQNYKGLVRERLMAFILDEQTITEMGLKNPMTLALLKDYYSQPGYPEYKEWIKGLEEKKRESYMEKGKS